MSQKLGPPQLPPSNPHKKNVFFISGSDHHLLVDRPLQNLFCFFSKEMGEVVNSYVIFQLYPPGKWTNRVSDGMNLFEGSNQADKK